MYAYAHKCHELIFKEKIIYIYIYKKKIMKLKIFLKIYYIEYLSTLMAIEVSFLGNGGKLWRNGGAKKLAIDHMIKWHTYELLCRDA